ncbi:Uncharacterized protein Adt_03825 [Abeliophyllum distichum]|uniref:Uncharacterized protein n=1 Tax=Abeliophyllum distichum TaxID=126358 RepID=A0ABD1VZL1_9LAMI
MVKSKGQSVNIEFEIGINLKKSKRKTSTSGNRTKRSKNSVQEDFEELENVRNDGEFISNSDKRVPGKVLVSYSYDVIYDIRGKLNDFQVNNFKATNEEKLEVYASRLFEKNQASIEFNAHFADPPQSNPTGAFDGASTSRGFTGGCCNLNQVVMDRIDKIESKQSEIEAKQAEILSFQQDLKSQLNDLSGNVQSLIADFLNQMDKKFHSNIEEVVLNREIVLYSPILETEDEFENNDFNNYTKFEAEVQVEDNDGSQLKDFEVPSQVQYDRTGKAVVCDKINNDSNNHGATEFEKFRDMLNTFKLDEARLTLAVQLFKYAKRKSDEEFDTDDERV